MSQATEGAEFFISFMDSIGLDFGVCSRISNFKILIDFIFDSKSISILTNSHLVGDFIYTFSVQNTNLKWYETVL